MARNDQAGSPPDTLKEALDRAETVREQDHYEELSKPARVPSFANLDPTTAVLAVAESALRIDLSARKLVKATDRVARRLRDAPALASTERAVTLQRSEAGTRPMEVMWWAIKLHTDALSFEKYDAFIHRALCPDESPPAGNDEDFADMEIDEVEAGQLDRIAVRTRKPHLPGSEMYTFLKEATEAFLLFNCGYSSDAVFTLAPGAIDATVNRLGGGATLSHAKALKRLQDFMGKGTGNNYLATVMGNVFSEPRVALEGPFCLASASRMDVPCMLELIWSYWMEEGMLNQTVASITRRFQNVRRACRGLDPLAELELDPLRTLSGVLWGYLQDEPSRLSVVRRAY
jgi:hypothetical protein